MMDLLYKIYEKYGWNEPYSFPLNNFLATSDFVFRSYKVFLKSVGEIFENDDFNFLEENWDNAIVLDACRYEEFKDLNCLEGELELKRSIGSSTPEWRKKSIKKQYKDVVMVTANPQLSNTMIEKSNGIKRPFFKTENVWDYGWNQELQTVHPRKMVEVAERVKHEYPDKRKIFWFMQPHYPFIGEKKVRNEIDMSDVDIRHRIFTHNKDDIKIIWERLYQSEFDVDEIKKAYRANLNYVMDYVGKLIKKLEGRIIITSDLGNCFGEMGLFGHPYGIHIPPLINVPYFIIEKEKNGKVDEKKKIGKVINEVRI